MVVWNKGLTKKTDSRVERNAKNSTATIKKQYEKGRIPWNKGLAGSEDYPLFGKKQTAEHIRKRIEARKRSGKSWHSSDTKEKIGNFHKGKVITEEIREKMSRAGKGKKQSEEHIRNRINSRREKGWISEEGKKNMSRAQKKTIEKGIHISQKPGIREVRRQQMLRQYQDLEWTNRWSKACKVKPNKLETAFDEFLQGLFPDEYRYVGDFQYFIGGRNPDFANINGQKKLIEVYGDYWHENDDPQDRIDHFKQYGFKTLIVWESDFLNDRSWVKESLMDFHSN